MSPPSGDSHSRRPYFAAKSLMPVFAGTYLIAPTSCALTLGITDAYYLTGVPAQVVEIVESMDVLTGEWRREPDMPEPNQGGAYAVVGSRIYVIGGGNGNGAELPTVHICECWRG
jgi:hypothetical protein